MEMNKQGMTIIYTSHYMEEAEYLCSRICILDLGKIIACGTKEELVEKIKGRSQVCLKVNEIGPGLLDKLAEIKGAGSVTAVKDDIIVTGENIEAVLADIIAAVSECGSHIISLDVKKPNLEAVFLYLTGRTLRD